MESLQGEGYFEPSKIYKPSPNEKITANKYVLWRDRQTCFYTGLVLQKKDVHIDHIVPKTDGGSGTPDNLVVSYAKFNNFKSGTNDLEVVVNAWNEKYTNLQIDMDVLKRKIFHLKEFEKTRIENEVSYRETINNNIYDTYTLRNYLDTTRGQYKQQQEEEEEKEEEEQDVAEIIQFWDNNGFGYNNINAKTQLLSWLNNSLFKNPKEMILEAMNIACASNKRRLNYIEGILRNWLNESILTLEEAKSSNGKPNKQYKDEVDWDNL
ncbi:DnaD domain protein [Oceanobacillus caeni]|uniref:DnaD domain protein n=1 Tax=Oceanobacillus caeni TaxID=405946 RepID=UPI0036443335